MFLGRLQVRPKTLSRKSLFKIFNLFIYQINKFTKLHFSVFLKLCSFTIVLKLAL